MLRTALRSMLPAITALAMLGASITHAAETTCNRDCMEAFVEIYLDALVTHNKKHEIFAPGVRMTENGQRLSLGDGLWKTVTGKGAYRLYLTDPDENTVGFLGTVSELNQPVLLALRLTIYRNQIREIESIVIRVRDGGFGDMAAFSAAPDALFTQDIAPAQRVSRDALVKIADSYFTGLDEEDSGKNVPFDERCQRRENGVVTALSSDAKAAPMARLGCKAQFDTGFSAIVTDVRGRRYPVVDVERGLVFAVVSFDHTGAVPTYRQPDGKVVEVGAEFRRPRSMLIGELFRIEQGKIRKIEAAVLDTPYGMPSGWDE
jgi:hypothetical protein